MHVGGILPHIVARSVDDRQARCFQNHWKKAHEHVDAHCIADGCSNIGLSLAGRLHLIKDDSREALESSNLKQRRVPIKLANPMSS